MQETVLGLGLDTQTSATCAMLENYALMMRIRLFELRLVELFAGRLKADEFHGPLHTYVGEEAIAVGICAALRPDDYVFSTHRGHGHAIARGIDLGRIAAEIAGRSTGVSGGHGGSMHLYDAEHFFMGTNGVVGGGLPLCLGTAFASVYRGDSRVTVAFFGDGATAQGSFHESLNMAAIMKWPILYVCENNFYAATTHVSVNCPLNNIAGRAAAYGIAGVTMDGNDLEKISEAAKVAVSRARDGLGPTLLECQTYRHHPHCMVIPEHRPVQESLKWLSRDPIPALGSKLISQGLATQQMLDSILVKETERLEDAIRFMEASPLPNPDSLARALWA